MFKMLARVQELEKAGEKIIHFEIGDPDFNTPADIVHAAIRSIERGETHYVNSLGTLELREAIAISIEKELGWRPMLDQVIVAPAISFIYFIVRALVNPGESVIVSDPGYSSYFSAFDFIGVQAITVPLFETNGFRLQADDLEKVITPESRLIVLNSPQNPTGAMIKPEELAAIYEIAKKHNLYILSDEVYSKMIYEMQHKSVSQYDNCKERTIILNGFSKTYAMTGWRLGYAIAPVDIVQKLGLMVQTVISNVPPFIQSAGAYALKHGVAHINLMMEEYKKRRKLMVDGFNSLNGVSCAMPDGAFYIFPNIKKTELSSEAFAALMLEKAGVAILPGTDFGSHGEGYVRATFAASREIILDGLKRMSKVLKTIQ